MFLRRSAVVPASDSGDGHGFGVGHGRPCVPPGRIELRHAHRTHTGLAGGRADGFSAWRGVAWSGSSWARPVRREGPGATARSEVRMAQAVGGSRGASGIARSLGRSRGAACERVPGGVQGTRGHWPESRRGERTSALARANVAARARCGAGGERTGARAFAVSIRFHMRCATLTLARRSLDECWSLRARPTGTTSTRRARARGTDG